MATFFGEFSLRFYLLAIQQRLNSQVTRHALTIRDEHRSHLKSQAYEKMQKESAQSLTKSFITPRPRTKSSQCTVA